MNTIQSTLYPVFKKYHDRIAIKYGSKKISYSELNLKSDSIAGFIVSKGMKKGSVIGVLVEDKMDLITLLLGIIKSGCAFMPLDPVYPTKRILGMIQEANPVIIFTDENNCSRLNDIHWLQTVIYSNELSANSSSFNDSIPEYHPDDMIYLYFTSGTTGKPKAIAGRNAGLWHFINWEIENFHIDDSLNISQLTPPCHDPFLRDVFVPLCAGGAICIPESKATMLESNTMIQWIEKLNINLIHCTPSLFRIINTPELTEERFPELKYVFLAGERVVPKELTNWYHIFGERIAIINLYGPTETTLAKLFYPVQPSDIICKNMPVGKPIPGCKVILLDDSLNVCNLGEVGEIYIRTPYRSLGYYNDPVLTSQKFIPNPFNNNPSDLIYKTGDLGRMLDDGNIEFLGRQDRQVKNRGFRVELTAIENEILKYPDIRECAVIFHENEQLGENSSYLAVYFTATSNMEYPKIDISKLRTFLEQELPDYMIPSFFVQMDEMPLTPNRKLDYNALPDPKKSIRTDLIPPRNDMERKLAEIWCEVLELENVGINENFLQVGGHSLKMMSLIFRIYQEFDVEIPLGELYNNATIEKIAEYMNQAGKNEFTSIEKTVEKDYYPASSAQKRIYFIQLLAGPQTQYNIPGAFMIEGDLDTGHLEETFQRLIGRHESLRTSFELIEGEPVQRIHSQVRIQIKRYRSCTGNLNNEAQTISQTLKEFIQPFDLSTVPLVRVGLTELNDKRYLLMVDLHHIIADGMSLGILIKEFIALYNRQELPELPIQYKDFSEWQNNLIKSSSMIKQEEYWLNVLAGEVPMLNIPTDFPRAESFNFQGGKLVLQFNEKLAKALDSLRVQSGTTSYMVLITVLNILLSKYSGQEDIIIGIPVTGRTHADLENVIGMFVNTLAVRNFPEGGKTFKDFLNEVKESSVKAFENQDYPFEELVEKLNIHRVPGRNPLFDVVFNMVNFNFPMVEMNGLKIIPYEINSVETKFELLFRAIEEPNALCFNIEYNTNLYIPETIQGMLFDLTTIFEQVTSNWEIRLADIVLGNQMRSCDKKPSTAQRVKDPIADFDLSF